MLKIYSHIFILFTNYLKSFIILLIFLIFFVENYNLFLNCLSCNNKNLAIILWHLFFLLILFSIQITLKSSKYKISEPINKNTKIWVQIYF